MIKEFRGTHRFLSNFTYADVVYEGVIYPTTEHAYQAAKTASPEERRGIVYEMTPGQTKRAGRGLTLRPDWEEVRADIMFHLLQQKFKHPELAKKLLATGNEILVEGNYWHDNYWGNCNCKKCKHISGKNTLGILLTKVRQELNKE